MSTPLAQPTTIDTTLVVRVIARDGKFLGDDIGGAHITVRDALTRVVLAEGRTAGGSGTPAVMCQQRNRMTPIDTTGASSFTATLKISEPRRIEVSAFGPLGALGSANTATATQWVYPGKPVNGGDGFLLELPGLIVQIVAPVTHYAPAIIPSFFDIRANVAMMCGCPISVKGPHTFCSGDQQPWQPDEFEVAGSVVFVPLGGAAQPASAVKLTLDSSLGTAGQYTGTFGSKTAPAPLAAGSYQLTVYAYQASTGNTGVDTATVFLN